jgi:uncharacterized protein
MTQLETFRKHKDALLRESPNSPLSPEEKKRFLGLDYFPESARFVVRAQAEPLRGEMIELATTTGEPQRYRRWAVAAFELEGERCALTLFADPEVSEPKAFFVPFKDATSGWETYGSGRYLSAMLLEDCLHVRAARRADSHILLDFNYAYNPYCAYSPRYRCPLPPAENTLKVPVRAGEKTCG